MVWVKTAHSARMSAAPGFKSRKRENSAAILSSSGPSGSGAATTTPFPGVCGIWTGFPSASALVRLASTEGCGLVVTRTGVAETSRPLDLWLAEGRRPRRLADLGRRCSRRRHRLRPVMAGADPQPGGPPLVGRPGRAGRPGAGGLLQRDRRPRQRSRRPGQRRHHGDGHHRRPQEGAGRLRRRQGGAGHPEARPARGRAGGDRRPQSRGRRALRLRQRFHADGLPTASAGAELARAKRRAELEAKIEREAAKLANTGPAKQANSDARTLARYLQALGVNTTPEHLSYHLIKSQMLYR